MTDGNGDQAAYWNGEVGQRWAASQAALDAIFAPLTEALFEAAALAPGERVLDIGCGAGQTSLIAAARLGPEGHVTAADLSAPLLAVARARAAREAVGAPIAWIEADVQTHDLGRARFDHALSRFGVMFFSDSVAAFSNVRAGLRPGARLTLLCWRGIEHNPWAGLPRAAALSVLPEAEPSPPDGPGPFRFAQLGSLPAVLAAAGFGQIACAPVDRPVTLGRSDESDAAALDAAVAFACDLGPVARLLRAHAPPERATARAAVTEALAPHVRDRRLTLAAGCWCVTARA